MIIAEVCCFLYHKVTKLKANHNLVSTIPRKINSCFLYHKVTKLKANHNTFAFTSDFVLAVSYITKLLN